MRGQIFLTFAPSSPKSFPSAVAQSLMRNFQAVQYLTLLAFVAAVGCKSPAHGPFGRSAAPRPTISEQPNPAGAPIAAATPKQVEATAQSGPADAQAMAAVLTELQAIDEIDPASRAQILEDLKKTPVELWPGLMRTFKATLAYRQQYQQRQVAEQSARPQAAPQIYPVTPASAQQTGTSAETLASHTAPAQPQAQLAVASTSSATAPAPMAQAAAPQPATQPATPAQAASSQTPQAQVTVTDIAAPLAPTMAVPAATQSPAQSALSIAPAVSADTAKAPEVQVALTSASSSPLPPEPPATKPTEPRPVSAAASSTTTAPPTWQEELAKAIQLLETKTAEPAKTPGEASLHASLRLLYLVAGRRDDALRPIAGVSESQQEFWNKQVYGLSVYLDEKRTDDDTRRAAEAMTHFRAATAQLAASASLVVRNLNFCTEVSSYGVFKKFDKYEFTAGQEVLLYAEIENYKSEQTDRGYHTALKSHYQVLDSQGKRIADQDFAVTEEHCQNLRRDFFVRYFVWMPKQIAAGNYTLQLTVEDTKGQKIGQSLIQFSIK